MRDLRALAPFLLALSLGVGACNCGTDPDPDPIPGTDGGQGDGGSNGDGGTDTDGGGGGNLEFTDFVRDLIENHTADDTLPVTTEDKTFVDSEDPDAFEPAFFQ